MLLWRSSSGPVADSAWAFWKHFLKSLCTFLSLILHFVLWLKYSVIMCTRGYMKNKQFLKSQTWLLFTHIFYLYFYFYFQYLSTLIFSVLLIIKHNTYQLLEDFYSSYILIRAFHFYQSHFLVRCLYFYSSMAFGDFIQD